MPTTLGCHLILGGQDFQSDLGATLLRGLLISLRPAELDQIIAVDSGIGKAGKAILAEESAYRRKAKLSKIEVIHRKWTNDFAAARNAALAKCTTDWWVWADGDDVLEGVENIRAHIENATEDDGLLWGTYLYAFDEYGNCVTQHDRERVHKTSVGWEWRGRIHETAWPKKSFTTKKMEDVAWIHHRSIETREDRNMPLLKAWYDDEPDNIRVWYYLGNQYFAQEEWHNAAVWYDRVWRTTQASPIDRYASMNYGARAWRNSNDEKRAIIADMAGITEFPEWADCYIGMCENFIRMKEWKKGIAMGETAKTKSPPDSLMFVNHLDYTHRLWNDLAICYAGDGQTEMALEASKLALEFRPDDEEGKGNVRIFAERVEKEKVLNALSSTSLNGQAGALANALPDGLRSERKARDLWVPTILTKAYLGTQPRITFYCGASLEDWYGDTPRLGGIGGSETAVTEVARRLAAEGWAPIVYNSTGPNEGEHDGVVYANWERFRPDKPSDVFVAWRHPEMIDEQPNAPERWLWSHDLHMGDRLTADRAEGFTKILGVSPWHAQYLKKVYPFLEETDYVENGVDLSRFDVEGIKRNRFRFVYASSPDRGLATLLKFFPMIRKLEPAAELHIFYGWESFLASAERTTPDLYRLHAMIMELGSQPGVVWRGRVPQDELAREFLAADIWAYPTSFLETFCITAVEAMAAGLQILTTHAGNIPYVVGDAGVTIPGYAGSISYGRSFMELTQGVMADVEFRASFKGKGPMRASLFTWTRALERWKGLLQGSEVAV